NGASVLVVSADVANEEQMQNVIAQTQQQFGQLNGVIHAAGVVQGKSIEAIENITKTDCEEQFKPKVHGLLVLEKVLQNQELDFCLLLSSLASILGGLGFVAYSAANTFMDTFVHQQNRSHTGLWSSISWDGWRLEEVKENEKNISLGTSLRELAIEPEEGIKAVQKILNYRLFNHIIVSTGELQARIKKWIKLELLQTEVESQQTNLVLHSRPDNLQNSYVAPSSEIEQKLCNIWQNILGIKDVGIYDNFFELGGDSLLAIQIISHLRETFQINFSLRSLFDEPTIAGMSKYIDKTRDTTEKLLDFSSFTSSKREEFEL
ncbi:MAG: SDR family NAD(P)-dependent oxidoreductase, partial [Cyanobacteria bacterium P01_H01_bin.150]